mmetsp:Transcript_14194/g.19638  ORF Transcript_14194/g.19638 Transcript_14194/m.19638 type:complete len:557 (-) Transcript_14194:129-1799(-)|eukprot:CAMPEP_0201477142 /NCGR_PEP_ID=MMETSP0151_2-20130828/2231_1 /ASSEMBLY_ACC=CAM_ASM_000257 /TAXON_ID=200890 /ORGANISM="Paramoeba atlantica, Strain 621/1 / CCAP 1560/9" /LENGTH=556 /DNA_ID=CAMNT_0047857765 /DNA_START=164 /DNA_END=1834 /DNA_ORIENTATION=-
MADNQMKRKEKERVITVDETLLPNKEGEWPKRITEKAQQLSSLEDEGRLLFRLPSFDFIVQQYHTSFRLRQSALLPYLGTVRLTFHSLCFYSSLPEVIESIRYQSIKKIQLEKSTILLQLEEEREISFSLTLGNTTEAFNLLTHLWNSPVSFFRLEIEEEEEDEIGVVQKSSCGWGKENPMRKLLLSDPEPRKRRGSLEKKKKSPPQREKEEKRRKRGERDGIDDWSDDLLDEGKDYFVAVDKAREANRFASQAVMKGEEILLELDRQRELLFRLEAQSYAIEHKIDLAHYYLGGIESFSGAARNLFRLAPRNNPKVMKNEIAARRYWKEQEEQEEEKGEGDVRVRKVDILLKHINSDMLQPCLLCFKSDKFYVYDKRAKKMIASLSWSYESVQFVVARTRPLHLDIHFGDNVPRFRLASSYIQAIANELYLRCAEKISPIRILFEPSAHQFDYGSYQLALTDGFCGDDSKACAKKVISLADLLQNASEKTKNEIREVEALFEEINAKIDRLRPMANEIGRKVDNSINHIETVGGSVNQNHNSLKSENVRLKKFLN